MIVFDLRCGVAHVFEAWFGSSDDYESQRIRGLIACPVCCNTSIEKAVMAPAVSAKGNRQADASPTDAATRLLALQRQLEAGSDYVGDRFAQEARALHENGQARSIYGEASQEDAAALVAEGIALLPMPFRPLIRSDA